MRKHPRREICDKSKHSKWIALFVAMVITTTALSADLPPQEQQALAKQLGEKTQRFEMWTDDDGNVTGLIFINHQSLTKSVGEKLGIDDSDLLELAQFPKLTAINIEAQPIGDAGLAVLKQFPQLKQVGFHYMAKAKGANASPDFISVIDGMGDLEIIEIKHSFRMNAINVEKLKGPFPKVWRLVLDTPLTAEQTIHMIRLCPNVTDLQLHRTQVSPEQLAEIGKLLPKLEVLWLKPQGDLKADHLAALEGFEELRIFSPQHFKNTLPYEGGWKSLTELPNLQRLELADDPSEGNRRAIDQLKQEDADLVVENELTRSRNYAGL